MAKTFGEELASLAKGVWWLLLLRAILAIIFGVVAIMAPGAALTGIAFVLGFYLVVDGVAQIVQSIQLKGRSGWGWLLFQGIVAVLAGLVTLIAPGIAGLIGGLFVLWTIVIYSILHGAFGIASASGLAGSPARGWGIASAIFTLLFGALLAILILVTPSVTVLSLIWVIGIYAIVLGVTLLVAVIRARSTISKATKGYTDAR